MRVDRVIVVTIKESLLEQARRMSNMGRETPSQEPKYASNLLLFSEYKDVH
jgi:hypothetical protein